MLNFKDFLKKYSFINNDFLNDFYDVINEKYIENYNEFIIDSEILRKWLKITKRENFIETIKKSYKINKDYIIKKIKNSQGRGTLYDIILLTPETAKKLCINTKSLMGNQIRQYFIDIELVLFKYKDYIIKGMENHIKELENNQKPKINNNKKIIYVFKALNSDLTLYKLGKTINSKTRFNNYNSSSANDIQIIFQYETENINQLETCVKSIIKKTQYRKRKEIYEIDINLLKEVIKNCDNNIIELNNKILNNNMKRNNNEKLYMFIPNEKFI